MVVGVLGCLFGVLGIFTIGIVFVPLAMLCGLASFVGGLIKRSFSTTFVGFICLVLSVVALLTSPVTMAVGASLLGLGAVKVIQAIAPEDPETTFLKRFHKDQGGH